MASIITAYKNITSDNFWGAKLLAYTAIAFVIAANRNNLSDNIETYFFAWGLFLLFMLGVSGFMMNRNINNRTPILPNIFDIILVIKDAVCMFIVMAPFSFVMYFALNYYNTHFLFQDEAVLNWFFWFAIVFTCLPFIFIPAVLYSVRGNLLDAYRFKNIIEGAGNFIVQAMAYCLQYGLIVVTICYLFYRIFQEMLGAESVFVSAVIAFFAVLSVLLTFSFCSDLYIDVIPEIKNIKDFRNSDLRARRKIRKSGR